MRKQFIWKENRKLEISHVQRVIEKQLIHICIDFFIFLRDLVGIKHICNSQYSKISFRFPGSNPIRCCPYQMLYHLKLLEELQDNFFTGYPLNLLNDSKDQTKILLFSNGSWLLRVFFSVRDLLHTIAGLFQLNYVYCVLGFLANNKLMQHKTDL